LIRKQKRSVLSDLFFHGFKGEYGYFQLIKKKKTIELCGKVIKLTFLMSEEIGYTKNEIIKILIMKCEPSPV